jgi:hypothetical protein
VAVDDDGWEYYTVFPHSEEAITGTGADATEKDKSARYNILDGIRDAAGSNFYQKWGGVGDEVTLP